MPPVLADAAVTVGRRLADCLASGATGLAATLWTRTTDGHSEMQRGTRPATVRDSGGVDLDLIKAAGDVVLQ
jgi:hypothetical protein